ncbi:hypothetical protein ABIA52_000978 [Paenarthrobacter histidinolovorans]|uniref:DUF1349 domain-containing protein n=1 Tax=Paenarthrobacter histidinolovorans TaxID=43664 RepID=A0ABW8N4F9_9MICC
MSTELAWSCGEWTTRPAAVVEHGTDLLVTAAEGSDAWRVTSYGFVHDTEHALLAPLPLDSAMEVEFTAAFSQQFDQAGIFVRVSADHWVKAGVEFADGAAQLGAVVTDRFSDWSLAPGPGMERRPGPCADQPLGRRTDNPGRGRNRPTATGARGPLLPRTRCLRRPLHLRPNPRRPDCSVPLLAGYSL